MFVEVIVDIKNSNVDKTYYYKIPEQYSDINLTGYRVEVPFGSRTIQGYVINVVATIDFAEEKCKEFKTVKDNYPVLTKELILLSKILADELYCTQIQVIEAMIPTILKNKYVEYYKLTGEGQSLFDYKKHFSKDGVVEKKKLEQSLTSEEIQFLVAKKIVKLISVNKDQLKEERETFIVLKEVTEEKLTAKQQKLVNYLVENKEIKKKAIKFVLGIGDSVVKKLLAQGVIQEIYREKELAIDTGVYINNNMLNKYQQEIFEQVNLNIQEGKFGEYLLYGVTGSGKTEIYIHLAQESMAKGKDVIILVPEIILTPQIEKRFRNVFGDNLAVLHSRLNKTEKYKEWKKIRDKKVKICLGTRSAIYAPFENLGLVIIDEEHESTYKQVDTPRYDAKDIAKKRGIFNKATVIYASATPSVDLYYRFLNFKKDNLLKLTKRFNNKMPTVDVIPLENKEDIISDELLNALQQTIAKGEQALLFINKRGYTNFIRCFECGHIYKCENCDISLNYHKNNNTLQCHFCGYSKHVKQIEKCCEQPNLVSGMFGIQKIEEYLQERLPNVRITRMDSDTTSRKGAYEQLLNEVKEHKSDILLGTQMISKGLDFPNITLVGILSIDNLVAFPSFKSNERLFQLLVQTSGRAGRSDKEGRVLLQSNVDSNVIDYAISNDYERFYNYEINRRELINYPPFCRVSFISIKGSDEEKTTLAAKSIYNFLKKHYNEDRILGPNKSVLYKINNEYTLNIAVRFEDEDYKKLHKALKYIHNYFQDVYAKDKISISIDNSAQDYV